MFLFRRLVRILMSTVATIAESSPDAQALAAAPVAMTSLTKNFSWNLVGVVTYGLCQLGILIALARLGNPVMVGQYALAMAVTAPALLLAGMSLRTVIATDQRHEFQFGDYLGLQLLAIALALIAVSIIAIVSDYPSVSQLAILLVALAKALELGSDLLYGVLQRHDQMDRIGKSLILKGMLSLTIVSVAVYLTNSVLGAAVGLLLSWSMLLVFYDLPNARRLAIVRASEKHFFAPRWNLQQLGQLAQLALPMGLTVMLGAVIVNLPRYFLENYRGEYELGIFAALAYCVVAGHLIAGALAQAALPRLSRAYAAGELAQFRSMLLKLLGIALCLGIGANVLVWLFGRFFIELLYGPEYSSHIEVFQVLMLSLLGVFPTFVMDYALFAARRFRILTPINAAMVIVLYLAAWYWIPKYGLIGAAWVNLLGVAVQAIIRLGIIWKFAAPSARTSRVLHERGDA